MVRIWNFLRIKSKMKKNWAHIWNLFSLQVQEWSRVLQIHPNWHPGHHSLPLPWHRCRCEFLLLGRHKSGYMYHADQPIFGFGAVNSQQCQLSVDNNNWLVQEYKSTETRIVLRRVDLNTSGMFRSSSSSSSSSSSPSSSSPSSSSSSSS